MRRCGMIVAILVAVVVAIVVIAAVVGSKKGTSGSSSKDKANVAAFQPGATARTGELSITLTAITDPYTSPNQLTQPKAGNRFVLIHASVQDVDKRQHTVNSASFKLKTADNHVYAPAVAVTEGNSLQFSTLRAGEVTEGDVVFEVPTGQTVAELRYDNGVGSDDLYWRP